MTAVLYGATGENIASNLYIVDVTNGSTSVVGPIGFAMTGLAQHPGTAVMYGMTSNRDPIHPHSLISVNLATGAGTFIGSGANQMGDISFRADGVLIGYSPAQGHIYSIDLATGVQTRVGTAAARFGFGGAISFNGSGVLWGAIDGDNGDLFTIDSTNGAFTDTGIFIFGTPTSGGGTFNAAAFPPNFSNYYAVDSSQPSPCYLGAIDLTAGAFTTIGPLPDRFDALAWTGTGGPPPLPQFPRMTFDGGPAFRVD